MKSVRDYGYPDPGTPTKPPEIIHKLKSECPNCGGECLFTIKVELPETEFSKLLRGDGVPTGTYIGCAACPYASPMATTRK